MDMDNPGEPLTHLRLKIREYARQQRQDLRTKATDALRFGLGQIKQEITELENLGVKDVNGLAGRIKRRKHATNEDMYRLSHAFLQGNENINAFAAIPGATQVLVKELTGSQLERQLSAAECLCNYSLGEAHVAEKITSLAGSYLVTYLYSNEPRLKRSSLWTLANLLSTCPKAAKTLLQMQLMPKFWKLYASPELDVNKGYIEDAGLCLYLLVTQATSQISPEDRNYVSEHLMEKLPQEPASEYFMYLIYQLEIECLGPEQAEHLLTHFLNQVETATRSSNCGQLIYGLRVMANVFHMKPQLVDNWREPQRLIMVQALNKLFAFRDKELQKETLRMLKNLINVKPDDSKLWLEELKVFA